MLARSAPFAVFLLAAVSLPLIESAYALGVGLGLLMWVALTQSWTILSGMAGYISLGHVVYFGMGAYFMVLTWGALPLWLALPLSALVNFVFAVAISLPVLRVRGPYFVILTFGLAELIKYVVMAVESALGQFSRLLFDVPEMIDLYWTMFALAVAATALAHFIRSTRFGQALLAIREDEEAAETVGVPVIRYKTLAYGLSAAVPGMVGGVMTLRTTYFEPQQAFDPMVSFTILAMAIIGGSDDARGPLFGAAFFAILSELLWANAPQIYLIILGSLLIGFVLLLPEGICGHLYAHAKRAR